MPTARSLAVGAVTGDPTAPPSPVVDRQALDPSVGAQGPVADPPLLIDDVRGTGRKRLLAALSAGVPYAGLCVRSSHSGDEPCGAPSKRSRVSTTAAFLSAGDASAATSSCALVVPLASRALAPADVAPCKRIRISPPAGRDAVPPPSRTGPTSAGAADTHLARSVVGGHDPRNRFSQSQSPSPLPLPGGADAELFDLPRAAADAAVAVAGGRPADATVHFDQSAAVGVAAVALGPAPVGAAAQQLQPSAASSGASAGVLGPFDQGPAAAVAASPSLPPSSDVATLPQGSSRAPTSGA